MEYCIAHPSPLGILTLTASDEGLTGLYLREPKEQEASLPGDCRHLEAAAGWLDRYFEGLAPDPGELTLLLTIPHGKTRTYGELAREAAFQLGRAHMSAQAVGGAVGRNPISIIIPCHRCVAAGGKLGGFGWGEDAKKWLLRHEGGNYDDQ